MVSFSDLQEETVTTETVVSVNTDTTESHAGLAEAPNLRDFTSTGVQTDLCFNDLQPYTDTELQDKQKLQRSLFMDYVLKDDESCKFYTGI